MDGSTIWCGQGEREIGYITTSLHISWLYYLASVILLAGLVKTTKRVSVSILLSYMFLVFASTVLSRTEAEAASFVLKPFRFFWRYNMDLFYQVMANVMMFIPIGCLSARNMRRPVLFGFLFSCLIEGLQLLFRIGLCEVDDIISNTVGVIIGFAMYRVIHKWVLYAGGEKRVYQRYIKRLLDIIISLLVLIVLSPVMLITVIAIRLESKGPAIFKQTRLGRDHREFTLYKFRSMVMHAEHTGSGVYSDSGDARVTKVGRILRATSIDELPQAINILRGDMSLIGPRPPLTYHPWPIEEYTREQLHMFDVRPGITGWAQVNGRKGVEWHERIELNNWYVDHCSFLLDVKIFFMTIVKVLSNADNANTGETVTKTKEPQEGAR